MRTMSHVITIGAFSNYEKINAINRDTKWWCNLEHQTRRTCESSLLGLTPVLSSAKGMKIWRWALRNCDKIWQKIGRVDNEAQCDHDKSNNEQVTRWLQVKFDQAWLNDSCINIIGTAAIPCRQSKIELKRTKFCRRRSLMSCWRKIARVSTASVSQVPFNSPILQRQSRVRCQILSLGKRINPGLNWTIERGLLWRLPPG